MSGSVGRPDGATEVRGEFRCHRRGVILGGTEGVFVPVSKEAYREAMARLSAAVNVVTTDGPGGRAGFTASAVCSVTDTPPTLLVCANRANDSYPAFRTNGVLCVSTLSAQQQAISPVFAGLTDHAVEARFEAGEWDMMVTGAPVLKDCVVAFDCRIDQVVTAGTHDVFFCVVEGVQIGTECEVLIYYGREYHSLG
jgi:flavin reductase